MARSSYGPSVKDGVVQYLSASSLTLGDSDSAEGCLRKWYYEKIEGRRPPSTGAQELGTQLHGEIEAYLRTGVATLGPLTMRGLPMLPTPGPDLFIEHDLMISLSDELVARDAELAGNAGDAARIRSASLATAPLRILDIPVVGYIDLLHARCTNKGVSDIEDVYDPDGTVEIVDWKTCSNPQYIRTPEAMSKTVQMTVYGKWATTVVPAASHIRLSHGYFVTRGSAMPRKVTLRLLPEQIERQWERVERVAGSIIEAARTIDVDQVPANLRACSAFGGCPHRTYCRAGSQNSLWDFFGRPNVTSSTLNIVPAPVQTEMRRLAREEVETKYPGLPAIWDALEACNVGHPSYEGELARVVGDLTGSLTPLTNLPGYGELEKFGPFSDPRELGPVLEEVKKFCSGQQLDLLPPDAPNIAPPAPPALPMKRGRGRPPGSKKAVQDTTGMLGAYDVPTPASLPDVTEVDGKIYFYVNCKPSVEYKDFWPQVHTLIGTLNKAAGAAQDFRLVASDHQFAYGKWKAAIATSLASYPLTPGHYVLDNVGGEIGTAVTEAMRMVITARGGVFVQ